MKRVKLLLISLVFLFNMLAQPALADRPPIDQNPDYTAIREALTNLVQARDTNTLPEDTTAADAQQQITNLQYQKYIMETGKHTICRNDTSQPIAIYGEKAASSGSTFDQVLYLLPAGEETDDDWACAGVYLPNDANVTGLPLEGAAAIKSLAGTQLVVTEDPETGAIAFNLPPASVFKTGDANWEIPDLAQADLTTQFPAAPID